jgi:hypothetical protein
VAEYEFALAEAIVDSDPVIGVYAACEWDCLSDDGKVWIAAIVAEAVKRSGTAAPQPGDGATTIVWPAALTPTLRDLLGFMCFELGPMAHAYQAVGRFVGADGEPLKKRAEDEQAFMLHRFLHHWSTAGDNWRASMREELAPVVAAAKEKAEAKTSPSAGMA